MSLHLAPLDVAVLALFTIAILSLGFSARLRDNSLLQFLMAGRNLSLPAFVATLVSTWYGGVLGVGQAVAMYGLGTWLLLGVPYYVFALLYAFGFAGRVRGAEQISIPERLEAKFGRPTALIGAVLVFLLAVPAVHVLMLGTMVQVASGMPLAYSVGIGALIGVLFLYKGGLLADVRVGFLAFLMMYIGFLAIDIFCLSRYSPAATLSAVKDANLHKIDGGQGLIVVSSFMILGAWTMVDPGFHQRVSAAATPAKGKAGVLVSVGFWMLFDVLSITAGMYALGLMPKLPEDTLQVYPLFADQVLPAGLKGLFLCGLIGTILSAYVGYTLVSGATIGREIVARVKPGLTDSNVRSATRFGLFASCGVAALIGLGLPNVVDLWFLWGGALIGALLVPVVMAYRSSASRHPKLAVPLSMIAAFSSSVAWLIYARRTNNPNLEVAIGNNKISIGTLAPALAVSLLVLFCGEAIGRIKRNG